MKKWVYLFEEGGEALRPLLGGKGAGLAEMTRAGLPVPPGFTITTEACIAYFKNGNRFPEGMWEQTLEALRVVEAKTGKTFGGGDVPLLVSVRSGARVSMPGMMDTVLNLGINDRVAETLIRLTDNPRFVYDAYRRFIQMFGDVVMGVDRNRFEGALEALKERVGARQDTDLTAEHLQELTETFKGIYQEEVGAPFPDDPYEQLRLAIEAVFRSWNNKRAIDYRRFHGIPDDWGTAVNVVTMVYGNMGEDSCTGVAFTRNPSTGEKVLYGEFLVNAQGEDVVAGIRTPLPIEEMAQVIPSAYEELKQVAELLERHYRDMQDLEFTVERGKLWMLQTRTGKRTARAAVRIAVDMVHEGLIDRETAVMRVSPEQLEQLLHPMVDPNAEVTVLATGLPASPGAASGQVVFDADTAEAWARGDGRAVILVRLETSPDDFHGMVAAQGILTARGGMTSHAAVVARGIGKPCVVGAGDLKIDYEKRLFTVNGHTVREGDWITLDGATGRVLLGKVPTILPELGDDFRELMSWADELRTLGVRTNADTPRDAQVARDFGAEGIGLCRTEHMFFEGDRIDAMREMIVARTPEERKAALEKILPLQRQDFLEIFRVMDGLPVTIRLLDPPLHEFLPHEDEEIARLAEKLGVSFEALKAKVVSLQEANPMLGHRGCRLGIVYPEITRMQARAIFEAAIQAKREGIRVYPEIMVPLVSHVRELENQRRHIVEVAEEVFAEQGERVEYQIGTMIELPRAALTADEIARVAEFFSYGTNDLTQTTFGLSRDDSGKFLPYYIEHGLLETDPFQVLDRDGVGKLVRIGIELGRKVRPDLKVGICGEHGGEPRSVEFCHLVGMDYVSCSPYRVPIARLAAAQAAIRERRGEIQRLL